MLRHVAIGLAAACLALPAMASESDRAATRQLQQRLQVSPDDTVVMAQLARMYVVAGKPDRARRLYRAMLFLENEMLERAGGRPIPSHSLARIGLAGLEAKPAMRLGSR